MPDSSVYRHPRMYYVFEARPRNCAYAGEVHFRPLWAVFQTLAVLCPLSSRLASSGQSVVGPVNT